MTNDPPKPRCIPATLRHELIEYSSLLRALKTAHTLDVTTHLTEPYQPNDDEPGPSKSIPAASTSSESERERSESPDSPYWRNRDQWTRWPIPAKDVPKPDWSLQDEIESIARQVLSQTQSNSHSFSEDQESILVKRERGSDVEPNSDTEDEDASIQGLAESITPIIKNQLESLFALISAHTVARPDSMQNRIEPFDWRDLVNILGSPAAAHLVDETILQNVITSMEELFETTPASASTSVPSPSPATAIQRHKLSQASRSRLNNLMSKHTASLFSLSLPPPNHRYITTKQISSRRKAAMRKKKIRTDKSEDEISEISVKEKGKEKASSDIVPPAAQDDQDNQDSDWDSAGSG